MLPIIGWRLPTYWDMVQQWNDYLKNECLTSNPGGWMIEKTDQNEIKIELCTLDLERNLITMIQIYNWKK